MSHKQYEKWILSDSPLNEKERKLLDAHLAVCENCRKLNQGWQNSLQLIQSSEQHKPAPGFASRWQIKIQQEQKRNRIVKNRIILFSSTLFILFTLAAYIVLSGSFSAFLANLITISTQVILFITRGISQLTFIFNEIPSILRWSIGIFMAGVANMFIILLSYLVWKARRNYKEAQGAHIYAQN